MVTGLEVAVLAAVVVLLLGSYRVIHTVRPFIVNAVVGLVALILASVFGFGVEITPIVLLIVAIGGVPGAVLVVLLAYLGIAFTPISLAFVPV
ncbi:pro-sigmaK processing inhibitor BofA family protein [Halalkalicoccus sp. NIPERK01]|uniref:pro-sigmaK processing inhibitor BofA family protein n=1 Tax=Halalkalicoccus sp. NIPERK01 TaxID=3053469 RepID=UPI00256EF7D9|nr:pro-sigmaK processing inhibitor BofA family protein [Halalkalicoccus sp. NIPERK01]MDL5363586.1 pro-sigmaK processing inhibitor BofA family protein [Halalkalicoccus sp. NIPERK01]